MARVLIWHSHTLYAKAALPLAIELAARGHHVRYAVNRPVVFGRSFGFSDRRVLAHPTRADVVNPASLRFVAQSIGQEAEWDDAARGVRFQLSRSAAGCDAVIGTTKDVAALRDIGARAGVPAYALGYQHVPFVAKLSGPFAGPVSSAPVMSAPFFGAHPSAKQHDFENVLAGCGLVSCGFLHLDRVYRMLRGGTRSGDRVVLFHPGGYRGVVSEPGDSRSACRAKQYEFLERMCVPLLRAGLRPAVKVHPLRARFHDEADVCEILRAIEHDHGFASGMIECLGPRTSFWEHVAQSRFVLTWGSSSVYELWAAGFDNALVCNFDGTARSRKFELCDSIFLDSYEDFEALLQPERRCAPPFDPYTSELFAAYSRTFDGRAVAIAYDAIAADAGFDAVSESRANASA